MTPITVFRGKKVAVFGLGRSGIASCLSLIEGGAKVVAFDDDPAKVAEAEAMGIVVRDLRDLDWNNVHTLVLAPGVPLTHPEPHWVVRLAHRSEAEIIGDIELFCRERRGRAPRAPFAAITGTNGKSTTTALLAHILKKCGRDVAVGGNLGTPILTLPSPSQTRTHVVECSSYQIDLAPTLDPTAGVLLNLTPDHLDRHGTMEHYAGVKERLIQGVEHGGAAIVGADDDYCRAIADRSEASGTRTVRVCVTHRLYTSGVYLDGDMLVEIERGERRFALPLSGIGSLRGTHNAQNAGCAYAAARVLGLGPDEIEYAIRSFPGLVHRMEQVGWKNGVLFVNDSKATNTDAASRALSSFTDIFWIAGGRAKEGGIVPLAALFRRIRKAYLIGEAAPAFAGTLSGVVKFEMSGTLEKAVEQAAEDARTSGLENPVVLLSPACASFDQYPDFEVRGDRFRELVEALPGVAGRG